MTQRIMPLVLTVCQGFLLFAHTMVVPIRAEDTAVSW